MTDDEPRLIDTGGADDNVALEALARDRDPRFRPSEQLVAAVSSDGHGSLDRPIVPLLNALVAQSIETLESCAGGMLFVRGMNRRTVAALQVIRRPWMQMRWAVGEELDADEPGYRRMELWWSRRRPNWGGYMGTDPDWRWRLATRSRRSVHAALLAAARRMGESALPAAGEPAEVASWLDGLLALLLGDRSILGSKTWFEVVLSRDSQGWNAIARREFETLGSVSARTLPALRRRVDADPRRLINGTGTEGFVNLRAAMREITGKQRWPKLSPDQRRALLALYAVSPSQLSR